MLFGVVWLTGLFLPRQDYLSISWVNAKTAEKIYTKLTDTVALQYLLLAQKSDSLREKKIETKSILEITSSHPYQHFAFVIHGFTSTIERIEGEIQLSPDEEGIKMELRCRVSVLNNPFSKWKYWLKLSELNQWLESVKTRVQKALPS